MTDAGAASEAREVGGGHPAKGSQMIKRSLTRSRPPVASGGDVWLHTRESLGLTSAWEGGLARAHLPNMLAVSSSSFYRESTEILSFFPRCFSYFFTCFSLPGTQLLIRRKGMYMPLLIITWYQVLGRFLEAGHCPRPPLALPWNPHTDLPKWMRLSLLHREEH